MILREIEIEFRLTRQLSGSEFERFGNQYLRYFYKNKYSQTKLGLQLANNSTVTGQPDAYFSLPNYKFIFVEFTSQKKNLVNKLKKDLKSCLDESSHGSELAQIEQIDLVFADRLKNAKQETEIARPATSLGIKVTFHSIDQLVNAVIDDIRLAKALGMPIETGQILTIAEFIDHYERGRLTIGTPLSNIYLERAEYDSLIEHSNSSDIVVIQGQPGCGKTKLALEYIQRYTISRPGSESYCIVNQTPAIWDDVLSFFPDGKDYIILIDDANRQVDNLLTVLNHFNRLRGSVYKILITVRSYAFEEVSQTLRANNYRFCHLTIGQLSDEHITRILTSPCFKILNGDYHRKINQLAKGNPRLAIMLADLVLRPDCDITILSDVSAIYDEYYQRVLPDQTIWTDIIRLRVLGLVAVLRVVDTTNPDDIEPVLNFLGIKATELWRHIRYLEKIEIIEVYQDNAFRFTEQVFATYAFYQCFFKYKALDLTKLLSKFNESDGYRLKDSVLSVHESYNKETINRWVQPILIKFYAKFSNDRLRLNFLLMYYRFLLDEAVFFINEFILDRVPLEALSRFGSNANTEVVALLFEILAHTLNRENAIVQYELMTALINKQVITLDDVDKNIESYLHRSFHTVENDGPRFDQYDWLSAYLVEKGLQGSELHCQVMDCTLKHFLLLMYDKIDEPPIYRKRIWGYVDHRLSTSAETVKKVVYDYMLKGYGDIDSGYIQSDIAEVTEIIHKHFAPDNPLDCRYVHRYVNKLNKIPLEKRSYQILVSQFNGELYQLFCTLSFEHINRRERTEINIAGSSELRKRKIDEIRTLLAFSTLDDFKPLYKKLCLMWTLAVQAGDGWHISEGLSEYFLCIAERDASLFVEVFKYVLSIGLPSGYADQPPLLQMIIDRQYIKPEVLYPNFLPVTNKTASWLFSLFWSLPDSETNNQWFSRLETHLLEFVNYEPSRITNPYFLKRYLPFDSILPSRVLQMVQDVNNEHTKDIRFWEYYIEEFGLQIIPSLTNVLEELYIRQNLTQQAYDHDRKALLVLINRRRGFWLDFLASHYSEDKLLHHNFDRLSFVWSCEDYYELIMEALRLIQKHKVYKIYSREVDCFFERVESSDIEKVEPFIERFIKENDRDLDLINAIYLALLKSGIQFKKTFLELFLTYNTSEEDFSQIDWIKSSGVRSYSSGTITGDIRARQWEDIIKKIEAMPNPLTYLPHKRYIKAMITHELEYGNHEKRENFLRRR